MSLSVHSDIANTEDRIQTMAESRLRAARLFASRVTPTPSSMFVRVVIKSLESTDGAELGGIYLVNLSYLKLVEDAWGNARRAETWPGSFFLGNDTPKV